MLKIILGYTGMQEIKDGFDYFSVKKWHNLSIYQCQKVRILTDYRGSGTAPNRIYDTGQVGDFTRKNYFLCGTRNGMLRTEINV